MVDKTSHEMLRDGGDAYYNRARKPTPPKRGAAYGSFLDFINDKENLAAHPSETPMANSPATSELREAFARDAELQRDTQAKQQRIKAAEAPHVIVAIAGEDGEAREWLVKAAAAIEKVNADAKG